MEIMGPFLHDDVIKWKHFPRYWPFVWGIHRSSVNSPHKGQWRGALMFSLISARINGWVNNREAFDLRRIRPHYDVTIMKISYMEWIASQWHHYMALWKYELPGTIFQTHIVAFNHYFHQMFDLFLRIQHAREWTWGWAIRIRNTFRYTTISQLVGFLPWHWKSLYWYSLTIISYLLPLRPAKSTKQIQYHDKKQTKKT